MNVKEIAGTVTAVVTLIGLGYAAALKGGWVVDEARAGDIAQSKVEVEERARLEFVRQTKFDRLRLLNGLADPTPDERLEAEILRDEIKRITDRLAELSK